MMQYCIDTRLWYFMFISVHPDVIYVSEDQESALVEGRHETTTMSSWWREEIYREGPNLIRVKGFI
jgi:hypothetical protein